MKARHLSFEAFLPWRQLQLPVDWPQQFGSPAPLEVEIGFGNGEYLARRAEQKPERNFIGIELEWASMQRALRHAGRLQAANLRLLLIDAHLGMQRLFSPLSLQRVYSLFPCPWPKERHSRRRLYSHSFLRLVNNRLRRDGEALVVTDHEAYLQWLLEQVPGSGFAAEWRLTEPHFRTKYERKWVASGQAEFYELRLRKIAHCKAQPSEEIAVQARRVGRLDPRKLRLPEGGKTDEGGPPIAVRCREFLYDPERRKAMVAVLVAEPGLTQDFWIEIACRGDHWSIRPAKGCSVVPTPGVQRAVDLVWESAAAQD
ncbi:MAG: tRNA (guanosine(46)-N7)-methyltransferase TrmB [Candidatus Tectomicrobia bacterium]|nr:tRNA (guanosine(46)-N7)-methyltransferase TrmB [Candidatus Tectomicrobia bacterium]